MNERKVRASQKRLVQQREEAKAEAERLRTEIHRLSQPVEALVATRVAEAQADAAKARRERDAVLVDLEAAVSKRMVEKEQELISLRGQCAQKEKARAGLELRVVKLNQVLQVQHDVVANAKTLIDAQEKELVSLKMVEAKELRKRLEKKTALLRGAEAVIHSYQRVLKRMINNGHLSAVKVALDEENVAARLGGVEMEPRARQDARVQIRTGWYEAGRRGKRLGPDMHVGGQHWTPVLWDDEEDPDFHKSAGLDAGSVGND